MAVKHSFGDKIRQTFDELFRDYVVMPSGQIKTVYYERNVSPALLHIERKGNNERTSAIVHVDVPTELKQQGFVLLSELYAREDRLEDWETYLIFQRQCRQNHVTHDIADEYLPDEVLRRRALAKETQGKAMLPPSKKKKTSKKAEKRGPAPSVGGLRSKLKGKKAARDGSYEIQRERVSPALYMGAHDVKWLLACAAEREALADEAS